MPDMPCGWLDLLNKFNLMSMLRMDCANELSRGECFNQSGIVAWQSWAFVDKRNPAMKSGIHRPPAEEVSIE